MYKCHGTEWGVISFGVGCGGGWKRCEEVTPVTGSLETSDIKPGIFSTMDNIPQVH